MADDAPGVSLMVRQGLERHNTLLTRISEQVSQVDGIPAGGALVGPRLFLLAAASTLPDDRLVRIGTAVELLRRATLTHREPQDEDAWPGHGDTVFSRTLLGDALLAESFRLLAEDGDPRTVSVLSAAMASVAESELTGRDPDSDLCPEDRWRSAAAYYVGAATTGALVAGMPAVDADRYAFWGGEIGEARERLLDTGCLETPAPPVTFSEALLSWLSVGLTAPDRVN
jgi:hypothetical protein